MLKLNDREMCVYLRLTDKGDRDEFVLRLRTAHDGWERRRICKEMENRIRINEELVRQWKSAERYAKEESRKRESARREMEERRIVEERVQQESCGTVASYERIRELWYLRKRCCEFCREEKDFSEVTVYDFGQVGGCHAPDYHFVCGFCESVINRNAVKVKIVY